MQIIRYIQRNIKLIINALILYALAQTSVADANAVLANSLFQQNPSAAAALGQSAGQSSQIVPPIMTGIDSGSGGVSINNAAPSMSNNSVPPPTVETNPAQSLRPPVPENEFQKSVAIRSGIKLSQYGYDLFRQPNTYTPVVNVPIDSNYTLGPGDQIFVQGWGSISISYTADVASDGTIYIPKVGTFNVAGIKAGSLESYLRSKIGAVFKKFQLSATVSKIRSIQINVAGYALAPGTYTVSSLTSLSNAIFAVGGPAADGSLRHIELKRNGVVIKDFDMYQVLLKGNNAQDVRLLPGDIVYFRPKGGEVAIYDGVKFPAIYEVKTGEKVRDILGFAGGDSFDNNKSKVVIEQITNNKKINVYDYAYSQGLGQDVINGDIIHFMRMSKTYDNAVVLIGNVANPTRLQYRQGMRVKDVIPNKEALLSKSFWDSYSFNTYGKDFQNTTDSREKTTNRNLDAVPSYNFANGLSNTVKIDSQGLVESGARNSHSEVFSNADNVVNAGPISIPEADINWNYAAIIRIDPQDYKTHIIPFNLLKAINGDSANNIQLMAGDVIDVLSTKDVRNPVTDRPLFVFVDGEVVSPGVYEVKSGESIIDVIQRAGGLTPKAYVFGMELDRKSVQKKQEMILNQMLDQAQQTLLGQASTAGLVVMNAGQAQIQAQILQQQQAFIEKMRQIKPVGRVILGLKSASAKLSDLPLVPLENSDTIYIPPLPDTVDVVGQVFNPATFVYKSNLSVGDYIDMAGTENQFADTSNEYVLRADGTLYSRQQAGWFGAFSSRTLNPGDAIIVPQEIKFGSTLQNVMNWTQILANFGTAAAAIQVFK